MKNRSDSIRESMAQLSDESLVKLVKEEAGEYEPEALKIALEELNRRNIDPEDFGQKKFSESEEIIQANDGTYDLVSFQEVLQKAFYTLVDKTLRASHPEDIEFIDNYKDCFDELLQIQPDFKRNIVLRLRKQKMYTDGPPVVFWEVFGHDTETGILFALDEVKWSRWLGFSVSLDDLESIGHETFVAHCLYKMTANGFTEKETEENADTEDDAE